MADASYGGPHIGRIPIYGRPQNDARSGPEPPACIQNAMMTKDKKPFTYTPGGLDLSQIRTPSMARRLARQRSQEEAEMAYAAAHPGGITNGAPYPQRGPGGPAPPPPPMPSNVPAPPPPPPLVIKAPTSKSPNPVPLGERPEIVIPENPVAMLRKTNSPYHWEQEKAHNERFGPVPKFMEKAPSPLNVQMSQPSSFSQQPPAYNPQMYNNIRQNQYGQNQSPESPLHKPEPMYAQKTTPSPVGVAPTRDLLQRQDSQFNKSPTPYGPQGSPLVSNGSPNANWRQQNQQDSPVGANSMSQFTRSPFSPAVSNKSTTPQSSAFSNVDSSPLQSGSPPVYHTLPRAAPKAQENLANNFGNMQLNNNAKYNNVRENQSVRQESPKVDTNPAPWRTNTLNRYPKEPENNNNVSPPQYQAYSPPFYTNPNDNKPQQTGNPWITQNQMNQRQPSPPQAQPEVRYQSHISIPVNPRKQIAPEPEPQYQPPKPQKEAVYVTQEPVYYHMPESQPDTQIKSVPAWVKSQKEKTPPPEWAQRAMERKSVPRDITPPKDKASESTPEWVQRSQEMRKSAPRDLASPPRTTAQPVWSTKPSENRKNPNETQNYAQEPGARVIPIQMDVSERNQGQGNQQPQLRIIIDMQQPPQVQNQNNTQPPYSQPTQRIMRVLSPQLVRFDQNTSSQNDGQSLQNNQQFNAQPKTRIIPIQVEGSSEQNRSFGGRY